MKVDSIIKTFDDKTILHDIFLSCSKGEIIGLLGSNGMGKSTLLKIIFGSLPADQKFIKVNNKIIKTVFDNNGIIKYLPQFSFLPSHIKIKKIIHSFCSNEKSTFLLNNPLIKPFINSKPNELSGGQKRIIETLLIVHSNAEYILLDEPFKNIDPIHINELKSNIISESMYKGIIITDHNYREILDISTRVILLYNGSIKEVKEQNDLIFYKYLRNNYL
ncbi:ATP-binding cassette domain-containing protein [Amniculibacterium sp. G2-70]|uniref:ATP-binding cassette domain-containing protein n=1 Tax=Amniculibacterium sp. G2-70 TaxID=2767188 RepID=UPI0016546A56|nr:ATP-binding cassette domain-containing protein [Amniculibacterium sp. G2-70]MBS1548302.1 ATP-binding cassette domain-containing protein [Bacteroidota bacterium]